jgi:hypothetical protein
LQKQANVFFAAEKLARIPCMDRQYSIQFLNALYSLGANVDLSKYRPQRFTSNECIVLELIVNTDYVYRKRILLELLKTRPFEIEEMTRNSFRINWISE